MDKTELELKFKNELWRTFEESVNLRYVPTRFLNMFRQYGAVNTAKRLLSAKEPQYGLFKLWELKRPDLSLEKLVLKPDYKKLFTSEELNTAKKRLKIFLNILRSFRMATAAGQKNKDLIPGWGTGRALSRWKKS